jgi:hypothetical protein
MARCDGSADSGERGYGKRFSQTCTSGRSENSSASGRAGARFREPTWDELRGLSADERRAILEYFKRINAERP